MSQNEKAAIVKDEFLPFQKIVPTADTNKEQGILMQEIIPNLYIYPTNKRRVSVEGLLRRDVKNGDLYAAVEKHLKDKPHADISFAKESLNRFYKEYSLLRENGMDSLLHAAQYRGIPFNFCEILTDTNGEKSVAVAHYVSADDAIEFACDLYKGNSGTNTFAHELTHMLMKEENALDFVAESPFGHAVYLLSEAYAIIAGPLFDNARAKYIQEKKEAEKKEQEKKEDGKNKDKKNEQTNKPISQTEEQKKYGHWSGNGFYQWFKGAYCSIVSGKSYQRNDIASTQITRTKEIFASFMGRIGTDQQGMNAYSNQPGALARPMCEPLLKIAETYAMHDEAGLKVIQDTISQFKIPNELSADLTSLYYKQTQIALGLSGTAKKDLVEYGNSILNCLKQLFEQKELIMKQINEKMAQLPDRQELAEEQKNMKTVLKAHSAALKNNPPTTSEEKKKALIAEQKASNTQARLTNLPDTHDRHNSNLPTLREHWTFLSAKKQKTD